MPRRSAWLLLVVATATFTGGRVFGLIELHVIAVAMVAAVVLSIVLVRRPVGLIMKRSVDPAMPRVGEPARVEISVDAIRNSPLCRIHDPNDSGPTAEIDVSPLALGASARTTYRLPTEQRGWVVLGPATVEVGDPLGLSSRRALVAERERIVVLPQWIPVDLPVLGRSDGELMSALRRALLRLGQSDEFRGIREYSPGDDPRRINWKATARRTDPLVNEYDSTSDVVTTVFFDTRADHHDDTSFEVAVSVVTSLVMSSVSDDSATRRLRLVIDAIDDIEIDDHNRHDTAVRLATIAPRDPREIRTESNLPMVTGGHLNVGVLVTGSPANDWLSSARRVIGRPDALVVVTTGDGTASNIAAYSIDLTEFSEFADSWSRLVRQRSRNFV